MTNRLTYKSVVANCDKWVMFTNETLILLLWIVLTMLGQMSRFSESNDLNFSLFVTITQTESDLSVQMLYFLLFLFSLSPSRPVSHFAAVVRVPFHKPITVLAQQRGKSSCLVDHDEVQCMDICCWIRWPNTLQFTPAQVPAQKYTVKNVLPGNLEICFMW